MPDEPQQEDFVESTDDSIDNEIELRAFVQRRAKSLLRKKNLPSNLAEDIGQQALLKFHEIGSQKRRRIQNHKANHPPRSFGKNIIVIRSS